MSHLQLTNTTTVLEWTEYESIENTTMMCPLMCSLISWQFPTLFLLQDDNKSSHTPKKCVKKAVQQAPDAMEVQDGSKLVLPLKVPEATSDTSLS